MSKAFSTETWKTRRKLLCELPVSALKSVQSSVAAVSLAFIGSSPAADWPHWRGPDYNGISAETNWMSSWSAEGPKTLWRANVGIGFSSVSVSDGRVYTMGNAKDTDTVWCLDALTGRVLWRHSYTCALDPLYYEGGPGGTPTVEAGRVFTLSKKGHVFCLEAATGAVIWSRDVRKDHELKLPEWSFAASPFVEGDRLILNVGRAGLALDKRTGRTLWTTGTETCGYATPVPFTTQGRRALAIYGAKAIYAVAPDSGEILWEHPHVSGRDVNAADPIISGSQLLVSSSTSALMLDVAGPQPRVLWENKHLRNYFNPSVLIDGHLYGLDGTTHRPTRLVCLDWATGEVKWSEEGFGSGGLVAADGKLAVLDKGLLTLVKATPEKFERLAQAQVLGGKCWTSPVLAHGLVYCRNAAGDLVCVDLRTSISRPEPEQ
jgi:outer membrane protein assembly factor BamB